MNFVQNAEKKSKTAIYLHVYVMQGIQSFNDFEISFYEFVSM